MIAIKLTVTTSIAHKSPGARAQNCNKTESLNMIKKTLTGEGCRQTVEPLRIQVEKFEKVCLECFLQNKQRLPDDLEGRT